MVNSSLQLKWYPMDDRRTPARQALRSRKVVCLRPNPEEMSNRQRLAQAARVRKNLEAKSAHHHLVERGRKIDLELKRALQES
jgi:hypothetical protein